MSPTHLVSPLEAHCIVTALTDLTVWLYESLSTDEETDETANNDVCIGTFTIQPALKAGHSDQVWCQLKRVLPKVGPRPLSLWSRTHVFFQDPIPSGEINISYSFVSRQNKKMQVEDFAILKVRYSRSLVDSNWWSQVIGKGSFGKVMMVRKKDTGRVYAIKVLRKSYLLDRGEIQHTVSERKILAKNTNPFLVALKFSFQTPDKVASRHAGLSH